MIIRSTGKPRGASHAATHVALLRGVNLGRRNRVAMADLRELLSELGFRDVRTHLQSGNAVFGIDAAMTDPVTDSAAPDAGTDTAPDADTTELARRIEEGITDRFGLTIRCLVRSRDEFRALIDGNPLNDVASDGAKLMALLLSEAPDPALLARHDPTQLDPTQVRLGDRVIYQWCPDGLMAAPSVSAYAEKNLKVAVTARNWNTITKIGAMLAS